MGYSVKGYKKGVASTNAFEKVLEELNRKQIKIWVDKDSFTIDQ